LYSEIFWFRKKFTLTLKERGPDLSTDPVRTYAMRLVGRIESLFGRTLPYSLGLLGRKPVPKIPERANMPHSKSSCQKTTYRRYRKGAFFSYSPTGKLQEATHGHIGSKWGCLLVGGGALALTWSGNTYEILALASRAFAFYYLMQCLVAISVSRSTLQRLGMGLLAVVLGFITVFAVPAS